MLTRTEGTRGHWVSGRVEHIYTWGGYPDPESNVFLLENSDGELAAYAITYPPEEAFIRLVVHPKWRRDGEITPFVNVLEEHLVAIIKASYHVMLSAARPISIIELTDLELQELQRRVKAPTVSVRDSLRATIVSEGVKQAQLAEELGVSVPCVNKWSQRFERDGLEGLRDRKGRGRPRWIPAGKVEKVITEATRPPKPRTRWSVRTMAREVGISPDSVQRIWRANDIRPHLVRTFKVSNDKYFEQKFWDVIGLYLDPPERALVLCCDEKSQCQALERTQPGLPLGVGEICTKTHDYKRHGTITLFAALNYLDGKLIARTEQRHTHVEWLRFLLWTCT